MKVKDILRIQSTDELCVYEGAEISPRSGVSQEFIHVRVVDSKNYQLTDATRDVDPSDLERV